MVKRIAYQIMIFILLLHCIGCAESAAGDAALSLSEDAAEAYEKILDKFEAKGWKDEAMPRSPLARAAAIEAAAAGSSVSTAPVAKLLTSTVFTYVIILY